MWALHGCAAGDMWRLLRCCKGVGDECPLRYAVVTQHPPVCDRLPLRSPPHTLQHLFPHSFSTLVRVCNHKTADLLLAKHEAAASERDRCATAVAAARRQVKELGASPGQDGSAGAASGAGGGGRQAAKAAARLETAEARLSKWTARAAELEGQVLEAQHAALARPLGTAYIALFRCSSGLGVGGYNVAIGAQSAAKAAQTATHSQCHWAALPCHAFNRRTQDVPAMLALPGAGAGAVLPSGTFAVMPCPGPDDINWPTLWCTWQWVSRLGRNDIDVN